MSSWFRIEHDWFQVYLLHCETHWFIYYYIGHHCNILNFIIALKLWWDSKCYLFCYYFVQSHKLVRTHSCTYTWKIVGWYLLQRKLWNLHRYEQRGIWRINFRKSNKLNCNRRKLQGWYIIYGCSSNLKESLLSKPLGVTFNDAVMTIHVQFIN